MKKTIFSMLAAAAVVCSCTGDLEDRVDSLESRVDALETKVNDNVSSIAKLVEAASKAVTVTSVVSSEDGYTINFSDGTSAVITNGKDGSDGKDGADGKDGVTPSIGVAEEGGVYYWTVNGEFLLNNGQKVPVTGQNGSDGKDGKNPQLKIENGEWYYSFDGTEWTKVPVYGTQAPQLVVTETETAYIFTYGETVITLSKDSKPFSLKVTSCNEKISPLGTLTFTYELTGADETTHVIVESPQYDIDFDEEKAEIKVTAPKVVVAGYVMVKAVRNSDSRYAAQYISIKPDNYGTFGGSVYVSDENEYLNW
ncbi:MAG: PL29 family lyase N-terminal domain-containing protein [Candidatus Cryptobacteroides sp.]